MLTRTLRGRLPAVRQWGRPGPSSALLAAGLISLTVCAGCGSVHTSVELGPPRKLAIAINTPPSALYAPIYEALANGDFARGALAVSVSAPAAGQTPLAALTQGSASVAIASEPELLAARDAGAQLVAIGALVRGPLESIISLRSRPINSPTQLIGKVVATNGTALADAELATFLASANIPLSRVHVISTSNLNNALTDHKAIATVGGLWNYDAVALTLARHNNRVIQMDAAGVPTFTDLAIVVRLGEAHRDGALLRAFLQSLTRGAAAARADPQAAAALLAKLNPSLSKRFELAALLATEAVALPTGAGQPFGYQNPSQWRSLGTWMIAHGLLHHANTAGLAITNEFLPGQGE
jgi:putative hydroxymethylpyrimidine transport system substrate-binding protein